MLMLAAAANWIQPTHGALDLPAIISAAEYRADRESVPNPFRCRLHPPLPGRDLSVAVQGIVTAEMRGAGTCVINGIDLRPGDNFEGLIVLTITPDGVVAAYREWQLFLPCTDTPTTLRVPQ